MLLTHELLYETSFFTCMYCTGVDATFSVELDIAKE